MKTIISSKSTLSNIFESDFEFIESGYLDGETNMQIDKERANALQTGSAHSLFRIYGWKPWAVSLGYNQKESDIDKIACKNANIDIVRRPTGGRAVLHANELTYCVVVNLPKHINMHDAYKEIHLFLVEAIENIGITTLSFKKSNPNLREIYNRPQISASCFASTAQFEIEHNNRKIVGSAQRIYGNTLIQHGSILLSSGHEKLAELTTLDSDEKKARLKEFIIANSATLNDVSGRNISFEELSEAIRQMF